MYNKIKICKEKCGWSKKYDSKNDRYNISAWEVCPVCAAETKEEDYSPNL